MKVPIVCLFILSAAIYLVKALEQKYTLKQVLILSRHNVRTPLAKNLADLTPKPWPKWTEKSGYLTEKGAQLEGYMGEFFAAWLYEEKLLSNNCPKEEDIFVYANIKQRTKASAQAFVNSAFPDCNITVHYNNSNKNDPIFNPVIHNTTSVFKNIALEQMQYILNSLQLNASFGDIENILDYKDSEVCMKDKKCNLVTDKNKIINVTPGLKPNILGPLKIGNSAIDAFVMEHYEGFPMDKVAWGLLSNKEQWKTIMNLSRGYHNVIFNTTLIAKDIAEPLIKYMTDIFLNNSTTKVILLMGHDANIYTILNGMKFKPYILQKQYEVTPVGGKLVFQKWFDETMQRDLLKINYVYQSTKQMRNGIRLGINNPPEFTLLELEDCKVDKSGFCLWSAFIKLLKNLSYV